MSLVDRTRDGSSASAARNLIAAVHRARGLQPAMLRMIRDRWAASAVADVRETRSCSRPSSPSRTYRSWSACWETRVRTCV
jgi:hypothetical protein